MTIQSVRTLVTNRRLPSPPTDDPSEPSPYVYGAPDFPFKGWQPPKPEGDRQSATTSHESAFVIDNGKSVHFGIHYTSDFGIQAQAPLKPDSHLTKPLALWFRP
jgi:hypothetical protein